MVSDTQPTPHLSAATPPLPDTLIGQKVGEYVIEAPIAAGGMGIVYRAVHPLIGRRVAIKVVRPEMMEDKDQADRFLKEAQALSAIKHRGIIEIIGFGNLGDGRQYMVMEFLEGEPLESVMEREGAMSPARALPLIDEILSALGAAHKAGVVHRDLKPSNVFISLATSGERNVKVLDFGLAKHAPVALDSVVGPVGIVGAKSSLMAGTPEYIAPEQARGLVASPQTDLYCLGVMLFEMLAGELPFTADNVVDLMKKHVYQPAPRLSATVNGLPESLDALVAVLLEKDPEARPATADIARQTVTRILRELREQSTHQVANPLLTPAAIAAVAVPASVTDAVNRPTPSSPNAALITSRLPERIKNPTQPVDLRDRRPLVALLLLLLFVFGSLLAYWLYNLPPEAADVVELPLPTPPVTAPTAAAVEPPPPPPRLEKVAPSTDLDLAPLGAKKPEAEPNPRIVMVPKPAIDESDCSPDLQWKASQRKWIETLENTHTELMAKSPKGAPDPKVIAKLHALRDRVEGAETPRACVEVGEGLRAWQRTYNR